MKTLLIILFVVLLVGCTSPPKLLTNRVSCTAAGDQVLVSSMYGWIGITSKADADDAKAILASGCGNTPKTTPKGTP